MPAMKRPATATAQSALAAKRPVPRKTSVATRARERPRGASAELVTAPLSTTDKIIESAAQLFARQGYVHSTLDEVAALAGFTKGAVYYYFKDKESLLLEVLKRIEQRSIDTTCSNIEAQGGTAQDQLAQFVKSQTQWAAQYPEDLAILMLVSAETSSTSARVRTRLQKVYAKLADQLHAIIEAGKRTGEFSTRQSTRDTVLYLQAVHDGNMMIWYRSGTDPEIGRRLANATLLGFLKTVRD